MNETGDVDNMITMIKDCDNKVSFAYTTNEPIVKGKSAEDFLMELAVSVNSVLRQAKEKITGMDLRESWQRLYACAESINNVVPAHPEKDMKDKKKNFAYFMQYADFIVPGIITEIYEKYGQEHLGKCVSHGDMYASAQEKVVDCAWLYVNAKEENDEELMFACAKQLVAAQSNKALVETVLKEI